MTRSPTEPLVLTVTVEDHRVARLALLALGLTLLDAAIPSPLPGVKPGFANIVVLLALLRYGWRVAAWVSLVRVLAGSLLLGTFLAPGFWLALSGAAASLAVLALVRRLPSRWFGPVSLSIPAALAHVAGQLALASAWLLPGAGVLGLAPVFALAAFASGTANGLAVAHLLVAAPAAGAQSAHESA